MTDQISVEPTIITREYNAPMALVYDCWTKPEHLKNWMFPMPGVTCEFTKDVIAPGSTTLHKMLFPNGHEMWLLTKYEMLNPHTQLSFRQYPSNEAGEVLSNPQMPNWPAELRTTIELEEADGKTKLTLTWQPVDTTEAEAEAFDSSRAQHENGWGGGLEQLGVYLEGL